MDTVALQLNALQLASIVRLRIRLKCTENVYKKGVVVLSTKVA